MSGSVCLICLSLIFSAVVPHARCQSNKSEPEDSRERPVVPEDSDVVKSKPEEPRVRLKGLCRDGWSPGTMKDFSGKEIPICLRINPEALTWSEAQESCRKDYGFLMKFDSGAKVDHGDLLTSVILNGITKFWTGMHSENGHLIWDDLIPNQVRPHNRLNDTSVPERPWTWESSTPEKRQQFCGQMNIRAEDDRKRRKRSNDDDSNDNSFPAFDLSNFGASVFGNDFSGSNNAFPPTSAFESMLSRTQMSDQLELPGTLGLQSEPQIPGSGLLEANIQNGGLATNMPMFEPGANFEQPDIETVTPFGNLNTGDGLNTESNENSVSNPPDLLTAVKEVAATIGSNMDGLPTPTPTEAVETLRNLIQENVDNFKADNTDSGTTDNHESFGSETTVIPPTTIITGNSNGLEVFNVGNVEDASTSDHMELTGPHTVTDLTDKIVDDSGSLDLIEAKTIDVVSALTGGNIDDIKNLDSTVTNKDDITEKMTTGIIDESVSTDNLDLKEKDITIPFGNNIANFTTVETVATSKDDSVNEKNKNVFENVVDGLTNTLDIEGPTNDVTFDGSLGYGQLTDLLTNEAVNEALNIKSSSENKDSAEDIVSDILHGAREIELQTELGENIPENMTNLSDGKESSVLENIDPLDTVEKINENVDAILENVDEKRSELVSDIENVTEDNTNSDNSRDLYVGVENQDDNKIQLILTTSSPSDEAASDIQEFDDLLTDVNEDDSNLEQRKTNKDDAIDDFLGSKGQNPSEIISEIIDDPGNTLELGNTDEAERLEDGFPTLLDNISDAIDNQDVAVEKEQNEGTDDKISGINDGADFEDIGTDNTDGLTDTNETLDGEREPVNTEYFEDMAVRLGLSGESKENEDAENVDTDRATNINEDPLEDLKDLSEKSLNQKLPDEMNTDTERGTDNLEPLEDMNESMNVKNDDGQTKRDSDWSEFDWNDNEQASINENPLSDNDNFDTSDTLQDGFKTDGDFGGNDGNSELHESLEKMIEDDKSFQQNGNYVSDVFEDFNEMIDDSLNSQKDMEINTEYPDTFFEDKEEGTQKETDTETEIELPGSHIEDLEEGSKKETDTEIETEIPGFNTEDIEGTQEETGREIETEIPDTYFEAEEEEAEKETDTELDPEVPDSYFEDKEERDRLDDIPDLAEDMVESDRKTALEPAIKSKEMQLSSCEVKLPSVCFGYEVEVMDKASTCENGWYGHVLLDTCYQILQNRMTYRDAVSECKSRSARLVLAGTEFERTFVLIAVQKDARLFRGAKFWMESPSDKLNCKFFDERGLHTMPRCDTKLHAVCVKDAKPLSVDTTNNMPIYGGDLVNYYDGPGEQRTFLSKRKDNKLPCKLTSAASEFPVLWFKDGVLVETKDKYISTDISLYLNAELVSSISMVTDRNLATPVLQGQYWCEVWDRQTLTRKRSDSFNVRFSDVISFHGSMELPAFSQKDELLFNMANRKFPELSAAELDIKKVFTDVLPMMQSRLPDVIDVFTYIDGIRSNPNVIEYHTYFTLTRDYRLQDEDTVYNRLKALLRTKLGNRYYMASLPGQTPLSAFRTMSLQSTVSCPAATLQTTRDLYGHTIPVKVFSFPKASLGEYANSIDNCSITNLLPSGTARCLGDFYTGAYWGEIVANECIEEADIDQFNNQIWGASPYTDKLTEMAQVTVDARNVEKLVSEVAQIAKVAPKFTPTDINKIADVLDHTTQVRNLPQKVGEDVLKTVDRLMTISEKEAHVANVETKAANRIIKSLERYAENADIGTKDQVRLVSDNVVVEIWNLKPSIKPVIGLAAETRGTGLDKPFKTESIATVYNKSQLYAANVDAAIELPTEVFSMKEKGASVSDRLTMMVFRKSKLFKAAITDGGRQMSPTEQQLTNLNSFIISASIAGKKLQDLSEKVKTIFKPIKDVESGRSCVWWDFDMNNFKGGWSNKGCVYDGKVNGRDVCLCDHLTNFAVLIDFYGQAKPIPDHHELTLSIITVLGLSCSILGLSLTIISYLFFRKLRQGRAQQTLFNLSLSLLLSMLVFLVGVKQTHNYYGCVTVAILLHYLILVSFMWMLMEAILQYLTFVKILGTYITRFTLKTVLPAWGLPLIPVIAVLCVDYTLYKGGPNYCWMDLPAFYYAFAIPVTCIIVINIIIFIVTIVSIFRRGKGLRSNQKKQKMAMTNLQAAITSFILLGLTWIFGYFAISDARLPFQYVFTILNSLQGFFIFILFVVRKKKVREQWYFICCKGIEKDRVSRSLSASNSIPSTYSNGSNRNSRKDPRERDRSDSTKTVQSTYSNASNGFTNYGYDHGYDFPFSRYDRRAFRNF